MSQRELERGMRGQDETKIQENDSDSKKEESKCVRDGVDYI